MDSPANFSKYNLNTIRHADDFLKKYEDLFEWNEPEEMLEIGGGDGRIADNVILPFVAKRLGNLLSSDISQEAVDIANKTYSKSNLTFMQMDIADPKVGERFAGKFGHIFAFYCFQLVRPSEAWAQNVFKMLKPNGQVFATLNLTPNVYTKVIDDQKADKTSPWVKYVEDTPDMFVNYGSNPKEAVSKILENAGFTVKMIEVEFADVVFTDEETLRGTHASVNPVVKNLPEELREAYMEDWLRRCRSLSTKDENGHYKSKMRALVFLASKSL